MIVYLAFENISNSHASINNENTITKVPHDIKNFNENYPLATQLIFLI